MRKSKQRLQKVLKLTFECEMQQNVLQKVLKSAFSDPKPQNLKRAQKCTKNAKI